MAPTWDVPVLFLLSMPKLHFISTPCMHLVTSIMVAKSGCTYWVRTRAGAWIFLFPSQWVVGSNLSLAVLFCNKRVAENIPALSGRLVHSVSVFPSTFEFSEFPCKKQHGDLHGLYMEITWTMYGVHVHNGWNHMVFQHGHVRELQCWVVTADSTKQQKTFSMCVVEIHSL